MGEQSSLQQIVDAMLAEQRKQLTQAQAVRDNVQAMLPAAPITADDVLRDFEAGASRDVCVMPAGSVVKVGGLPFELAEDAKTFASAEYYRLARNQSEPLELNPDQAAGAEILATSNSSFWSRWTASLSRIWAAVRVEFTSHVESK